MSDQTFPLNLTEASITYASSQAESENEV